MPSIMSITVTVRMDNGELRAGLELRAVTEQDGHDIWELLDFTKQRGLYDEGTKILEWNGLGGYRLYWQGLGVENRADFENISLVNWEKSKWRVLYMQNPHQYVADIDDLYRSETCLCQGGTSCQICRLQKRVKAAEFELYETQYELEETSSELHEAQGELGELKAQGLSQHENGEIVEANEDEEEDGEGEEARNQFEGLNAVEYALHRAETAETENAQLLVKIERLKRENKNLRKKAKPQRNQSISPMTQMNGSTRVNLSAGDVSDDSQRDASYPQQKDRGKTRPGGAANTKAKPIGSIEGTTGAKTDGKGGYAETTKDLQKMAKKHLRDTYDEDESGDEDEEPPFKRHRSTIRASDKAVQGRKAGRKTGANTCGTEKMPKKKPQDDSDDDDDESFHPGPQGPRSVRRHNAGRASLAAKANQTIAKTGRRTNNSQGGFLDALGLGSLPTELGNTVGAFDPVRVTNNSMSSFMSDRSDAITTDVPKANFSSATTTAATLSASTPANPAQIAATSRKAQGWADNELQALIALVRAHRNQPVGPDGKKAEVLHDVKLFELMSRQLQQQHGISRSAGACKNEWNRRGRQLSGIDNRKVANPKQMATSVQ